MFRCQRLLPSFLCATLLVGFVAACPAQAQVPAQVTQPIDNSVRAVLTGNVSPIARPQYDRGSVSDDFPAERMMILLRRSPQQEQDLLDFLRQVHTPGSAAYHHWLTPAQFGGLYGPADADIDAVRAWLQQQGFSVTRVTPGRTAIEFSGSAGQVRQAFHTSIHIYALQGVEYHAGDVDPTIPAALVPVVAGITPLTDFRPQPNSVLLGEADYDPHTHVAMPDWTFGGGPALLLAPGDFAVQYNLNPVYQSGLNGAGVTIGIIGASNVDPSVVATYRSLFSLPPSPVHVVVDGNDPGQNSALTESYLDVEIAGAVAPGATINLYTAADTTVQSGLALAAQRAVDDDSASILSTSYGQCEQDLGAAGNAFWNAIWEQAAAQGQTVLVSAGDGGGAGCDDFNIPQPAKYGLAVNGIGSTPWNVSVGGTDFAYNSYEQTSSVQKEELASYWNLNPSLNPVVSLLKPVPEQPWNRAFGLNLSTGGKYDPSIVAGSGGASRCTAGVSASNGTFSACTGGYPKPAWQSGSGVPADGVRDLPDLSLFAAAGENNSAYAICADSMQCVISNGNLTVGGAGGTSASTPALAGILALVEQKYGAQGQADTVFYPLAAQHPSVFHDIAKGSNVVPCLANSPDCSQSAQTDNTSGIYTLGHYYATPGYDQATGLGSLDASLLLQDWNSLHFAATTTSLNLSQTNFTHGTPVAASVSVSGSGGTPSGNISLMTDAAPPAPQGLGDFALTGGTASVSLSDLPGGHYNVTARYGGDSTFASSDSLPVSVDITPEPSTTTLSANVYSFAAGQWSPLASGGTYTYGSFVGVDAKPVGKGKGVATGTISFTDAAGGTGVSSGALALNSEGLAEWSPAAGFAVGPHSISATYSGDASYGASTSAAPVSFTVTKANPGAGLTTSPLRAGLGDPVSLTAAVGLSYAQAAAPTGTVTFSFGSTVLGTFPLTPYPGRPGSHASMSVSSLPLGNDAITAQFSGDANYSPVSTTTSVTVVQSAHVSATASPLTINQAQTFTVNVSIPGVSGQPAPTGGIGFTAHDSCCNSYTGGAGIVNGQSSYTFSGSFFQPGPVVVTAIYYGDTIYAPASTNVSVRVDAPFSITGTDVTLAPGATTGNTSTLTLTPADGYTGTVNLGCSLSSSPSGALYPPTCIVTPSVSLSGSGPATATLTVQTLAARSALATPPVNRRWLIPGTLPVLALVLSWGYPGRRRLNPFLSFVVAAALLAGLTILSACGSSPSKGSGPSTPGTTPGAYTFTVTGSGSTFQVKGTVKVSVQ